MKIALFGISCVGKSALGAKLAAVKGSQEAI